MPAALQQPNPSFFSMRLVLGVATYILTFRYNARMNKWICDIADASNNNLLNGQPVNTAWPILGTYFNRIAGALPPGLLLALDMTGQGRDACLNDFGGDIQVFYYQPPAST